MFISYSNLAKFLEVLKKDYRVFVPAKKQNQRFFRSYQEFSEDIVLDEVRTFEPLKMFYNPPREKVAEDFQDTVSSTAPKPYAIVGVKACDLKGFKIQDFVFMGQDVDPFYSQARQENLIISADCSCALETCFCLAVGVKPYPEGDFDLNLSHVEKGYLVQVGSAKGERLVKENSSLFEDENPEQLKEKERLRTNVLRSVQKNLVDHHVPFQDSYSGMVEKKFASKIWEDEASTCVECGACNTICPTCHCFLLSDQKCENKMLRTRHWDSCLLKDFARVAGGANPRKKLFMRLRNRFEKKFDFFPKVANVYACTGCGRCISACPGKIDIRRVLKRLVENESV